MIVLSLGLQIEKYQIREYRESQNSINHIKQQNQYIRSDVYIRKNQGYYKKCKNQIQSEYLQLGLSQRRILVDKFNLYKIEYEQEEFITLQLQIHLSAQAQGQVLQRNNHTITHLLSLTSIIKPSPNQMLLPKSTKNTWSKRDIQIIAKYRERIKDLEDLNLQKKLLTKEINSIDFYKITPKEDLPKFLQKMKFQTLHSKQNVTKVVKVFKKERETQEEASIRRKLKNQGEVMFLSEIYQNLGEQMQPAKNAMQSAQTTKFMQNYGGDLQQWEKTKNNTLLQKLLVMKKRHPHHQSSPRHRQSRIIQEKLSQLHRKNSNGRIINYFKQGSNYKKQIQKQLDIIYFTHSSQPNQVNKYILIQNSSKLLKKELDQRKIQVEEQIKSKLKILNQTRIQHHNLFQQKSRLILEERQYSQEITSKEQYGGISMNGNSSYFTSSTSNKLSDLKTQKRQQIEQNQIKIIKNKRLIQSLENGIQNSEEEIRSIMIGEISFFKMSLKIGMDCRDTGLGWILKKLRQLIGGQTKQISGNANILLANTNSATKQEDYEFPLYLDKKSKEFLIIKTQLEDQLEQLLQQKRKFVNQIGQSNGGQQGQNSKAVLNKTMGSNTPNGWAPSQNQDKIVEDGGDNNTNDIPKKYRRSLRKITILNQQYAKNQSLLEFKPRKSSPAKGVQLSTNTDGLTGKRLYETISEKIKFFDFSKIKKDKSLQLKNNKLLEYQNLLNQIKDIHIKIEDSDIQHENHLTNHYKENKEVFLVQCAACFGYKKSYTMIIKYFSWKNGVDTDSSHV